MDIKLKTQRFFKLFSVITGLSLLAACQSTATHNINATAAASSTPMASVPSWTAEDFMNAKPLPMPIANATVDQLRLQAQNEPPVLEPSVSEDGDMGEGNIGGATNLFDASQLPPAPINAPTAVGTQGLYYSSSRLIPQSARLSWPYRTAGKLFFRTSTGTAQCSGSVIKRRLIVTAGHCVHSGTNGNAGYYSDFVFIPAYSVNGTQAPFGTWTGTWAKAAPTWVTGGGGVPNGADFGIIEVADQVIDGQTKSISQVVGRLGYKTQSLNPNHVKMLGYPGSFDGGGIMHQVDSGSPVNSGARTVMYGSDMTPGSSGGPWVQNFGRPAAGQPSASNGEMNRLVGVSSYAPLNAGPMYLGSSTLNSEFITLLRDGCANQAGNCQ